MTRSISTCLVACTLLACPAPGDDDSDDTTATLTDSGIPTLSGTTTADDSAEATSVPTTGDDGESSATTEIEEINCGLALIKARVEIPRVMLVLDKSGSMVAQNSGYWDADGDDADDDGFVDSDPGTPATPKVTRWRSLHETVNSSSPTSSRAWTSAPSCSPRPRPRPSTRPPRAP
jgi:hypothetical protein